MQLKLCFIAFMSFFSSVYSEISEVRCSSSIMTIEAVAKSDKTTIYLDNRTAWSCNYKDLFHGPYGWRLGDRVHIVYVYSEGYYLQNASSQGCVPVKLQNAHSSSLRVNKIKEIIKNKIKGTTTLVLNDGTRWFIGSWSSAWMKKWQVGDRIIVTEQEFVFGNADHLLLNLDQGDKHLPENVRAQLLYSRELIKFEDLNRRQTRDWQISIASTRHENHSFEVELSNQVICKCSQPKLAWDVGDVLVFDSNLEQNSLINLTLQEKIQVETITCPSDGVDLPTIKKISKDGTKIVLSDDSLWFSAIDEFEDWQLGNRVIVSCLSRVDVDTSTHLLINMDKDTENPTCSTATLVK